MMDSVATTVCLAAARGGTAPICESSAPPDVMGYHDAREIRTLALGPRLRLQDHMFEPTACGACPLTCSWCRAGPPTARAGATLKLRQRQRAGRIQDEPDHPTARPGRDGRRAGAAASVTRSCLTRHGIRRMPWGLDLRQPHIPDAMALCRHLAPPSGWLADRVRKLRVDRSHLAAPSPGRELALLHPRGTATRAPVVHHARVWNPLSFTTVRRDNEVDNVKDVSHFLAAAKGGRLPAVAWVVPMRRILSTPPRRRPPASDT